MRPAQLDCFLRRLAGERAVEKSRREPVTTADTIEHVQLARRRDMRLAIDPGHRAPIMPVRHMHLAQCRGDDLDLRMFLYHAIDHPEKRAGIELGFRGNLRTGNAQTLLQVLFIAYEHIDILDDAGDHRNRAILAARYLPELLPEIQIEGDNGAGCLGGLHALDDQLRGRFRECREDSTAVKPPHAAREDGVPIEIAGLQQRSGFVGAVVENHRCAHTVALVAIDGRDIRARDAVVLEALIERPHAHGFDPLSHQIADRVTNHRRSDACLQTKAVRQVGRDVELAAADVNLALGRLAKRNDARVQTVDQCAQRQEVQRALVPNFQTIAHAILPVEFEAGCSKPRRAGQNCC